MSIDDAIDVIFEEATRQGEPLTRDVCRHIAVRLFTPHAHIDLPPGAIAQQHRERYEMIDIYDLHKKMTAHLFPPFSNEDRRFLALALCGEAGEIANKIKKRWRDDVDLSDEIREEIADVLVYLELLAHACNVKISDFGAGVTDNERLMSLSLCVSCAKVADIILLYWLSQPDEPIKIDMGGVFHDARMDLEMLAQIFGIGGEALGQQVQAKLLKVANKHLARVDIQDIVG